MSEEIDDGGCAFPVPLASHADMLTSPEERGMSLRAWLAGQSLVGLRTHDSSLGATIMIADQAVRDADAIIERLKR